MNGLSDFDAVYVAMSFLVPGYVYFVVRGHLVPGHRSRGNESIIRLLSVSTVNFSIWAWAVYMVIEMEDAPVWARPAVWTFAILVSPVFMGLISGVVAKFQVMRWVYKKVGFNPTHITPTSWDFAFSQPEERFVLVTMSDGKRFAGIWGSRSFASDEPNERDVYIEKVYQVGQDNQPWTETNRSVLIRSECIRSVEFIPIE